MGSCVFIILVIAVLAFLWLIMCKKCHHKHGHGGHHVPPVTGVKFGFDQDSKQWRFYWPAQTVGCGAGYICSYMWSLRDPHGTITSNPAGQLYQDSFVNLPTPVIPGLYILSLQTRNQVGESAATQAQGTVTGPVQVQLKYVPYQDGHFDLQASYTGTESTQPALSVTTESLDANWVKGAEIPLPLLSGSATNAAPTKCEPDSSGGTTCTWTYGYNTQINGANGTIDASKVLREYNTLNFSVAYVSQGQTLTATTAQQIVGVPTQPIPSSDISFGYV